MWIVHLASYCGKISFTLPLVTSKPANSLFHLSHIGAFWRDIPGRRNVTVSRSKPLSCWEYYCLATSFQLPQNCTELFPLWSKQESTASRHRWSCQENVKCWYGHVQTMTHSGDYPLQISWVWADNSATKNAVTWLVQKLLILMWPTQ